MKLMKKTFIMQKKIVLTIQKPLADTNDTVMTMLMAIGIKKYAAASTVSGEDLPGVSQEDPSSVGLFVSSKMTLTPPGKQKPPG